VEEWYIVMYINIYIWRMLPNCMPLWKNDTVVKCNIRYIIIEFNFMELWSRTRRAWQSVEISIYPRSSVHNYTAEQEDFLFWHQNCIVAKLDWVLISIQFHNIMLVQLSLVNRNCGRWKRQRSEIIQFFLYDTKF